MKRLLCTSGVIVAVASLVWTSGLIARDATQPSERRNLLGVWELVSLQDHRPNGDVLDWMGKKPTGTLVYSPDGRLTAASRDSAFRLMTRPEEAAARSRSRA